VWEQSKSKSKRKRQEKAKAANLLEDSRFQVMFENPEYQVDPSSEEFQLLNPALVKLEKLKRKKLQEQKRLLAEKFESLRQEEETDEPEGRPSEAEESSDDDAASISDDDREFVESLKQTHRQLRAQRFADEADSDADADESELPSSSTSGRQKLPKMFELKAGEEFKGWSQELAASAQEERKKKETLSLAERLQENRNDFAPEEPSGNRREVTFSLKKSKNRVSKEVRNAEHLEERRTVRRSAGRIGKRLPQSQPYRRRK